MHKIIFNKNINIVSLLHQFLTLDQLITKFKTHEKFNHFSTDDYIFRYQ